MRKRKVIAGSALAALGLIACADTNGPVLGPPSSSVGSCLATELFGSALGIGRHRPGERFVLPGGATEAMVVDASVVAQLTGPGSHNRTGARWDVYGTDLGHMFWHRGQLYMVFGDTFGKGGRSLGRNWRSNTLARLAEPQPGQGLCIASMITGPEGAAKTLISPSKVPGVEKAVIPTHGISVDGRMYLHYMAVQRWGGGTGQWDVGRSGFSYSDDAGQNWTVATDASWSEPTGFEQVVLLHEGSHVYMFGIPAGRFGGVRLRRVDPSELLDLHAYEYWDGHGWVAETGTATTIVPGPVGEFSVAWNALYQQWMMLYLNPSRHGVMLRMAPELTGPWSEEQVVLTAREYPGLYAPYIVPVAGIGAHVYFTLSMWEPYNVFLGHMQLDRLVPATSIAQGMAVR